MNELQIKLTADIKDIQSALTKVKKTLKDFDDSMSSSTDKTNKKKSDQVGIIQKLNAELSKYKTLITKATSEAEIAKYNAKLQETQKELARLNALGKVFEQRKVVVKEEIGLIGQLNAQVKQLKVSLQQATDEQQVARLNAQLEQTSAELTRINSLGKSVAVNTTKSFDNFRVSAGAANGSAIAFNRVIQDAPFGIIGVGNNIQQLAEQFSALRVTTGSTGTALSAFFKSLFTGSNLLVLGISAATAAFTAYQLGAFDSAEETKDLAKELEDFKNSLDGVTKAQLQGAQSAQSEIQALKLLKLQAENANLPLEKRILAVKELRNQFPDYLKGLSDEEILLGNVGTAYNNVTTSIIAQAKAKAFSEQITENLKKEVALLVQEEQRAVEILEKRAELEKARIGEQTSGLKVAGQFTATNIEANRLESELNDLIQENLNSEEQRKKLGQEILSIESKIPEQIQKAGGLIDQNKDKIDKSKEKVEFYDKAWNENEDRLIRINQLLKAIADETPAPAEIKPEEDPADVTPKGRIEFLEEQIALFEFLKRLQTDTGKIDEYTLKIAQLRQELDLLNGKKVDENLTLIVDAFSSLGSGIAASLNIGDRALRGFVTTLLSATPKIIGAIIAKAQATSGAADLENASNLKLATGNAVVVGTEGAKGLGPVGLALLPVFIAGAVALVSSAFSKGGKGGGSATAGTGSTFTNRREFGGPVSKGRAYIVGERRPELFVPNTNGVIVPQVPSMDYSGASMAAGAMAIDVNIQGVSYGDDILFTVQQAQIRRNIR
jgi:hypothetical protein